MAEQVVRPGPFTVERNGEPVDVAFRMRDIGGQYEWLAPDRWHVLITDATPEQLAEEIAEAIDHEGVRWAFRPTVDDDAALVIVPAGTAMHGGFVSWLRRTVGPAGLGIAQPE